MRIIGAKFPVLKVAEVKIPQTDSTSIFLHIWIMIIMLYLLFARSVE
jgi:hypothetical protein